MTNMKENLEKAVQPEEYDETSEMKNKLLEDTKDESRKSKPFWRTFEGSAKTPNHTDKISFRLDKIFAVFIISAVIFLTVKVIFFSKATPSIPANEDRLSLEPNTVDAQTQEIQRQQEQIQQLEIEKDQWQNRYLNLKEQMSGTFFYVGESIHNEGGKPDQYDEGYKMFFTVEKKILLKSIMVLPETSGTINILLYNNRNEGLREIPDLRLEKSKTWYEVQLNFEIPEGRYYLTFTGSTRLLFHSKALRYPYRLRGIMEITGCDYGDNFVNTQQYMHFYDWKIALMFE